MDEFEVRDKAVEAIGIAARLINWKISVETEMKDILDETRRILDNPASPDWEKAKAAGAVDTISRLLRYKIEDLKD